MKVYKCDRCGRLIEAVDKDREFEMVEASDDLRMIDLCPRCYAQLVRWFRKERSQKPPIEIPEIHDGFIFK